MKKILLTENQFTQLNRKELITEVNLQQIVSNMKHYTLPSYNEFIKTESLPNNEESVAYFLSKSGRDSNWNIHVLSGLAGIE